MSINRARALRRNQTGPERALWRLLWQFREEGWHFRRQQPIGPYYADFACMHAALVIEVDGQTHISPEKDALRDKYMRSRGLQVLRVTNDDVLYNPDGVYTVIAGVLAAVSAVANTPHPSPPLKGGRRRKGRTITAKPTPDKEAAVRSPSPLRGGDRGGGAFPAPDARKESPA